MILGYIRQRDAKNRIEVYLRRQAGFKQELRFKARKNSYGFVSNAVRCKKVTSLAIRHQGQVC
jgi:hypothetical protein